MANTQDKYHSPAYKASVARIGAENTHDPSCRTWRGLDWPGACNCSLRERTGSTHGIFRVTVHGPCDNNDVHRSHIFPIGKRGADGLIEAQECPGQTVNWEDRKVKRSMVDSEVIVYCPGCDALHTISVQNPRGGILWNQDERNPTFSRSLLVEGVFERIPRCHARIENGWWIYLNDSAHEYSGQTVEMMRQVDWP